MAQEVDEGDPVRVPSIRGQLRFWWRALHACLYADAEALHRAEREIWGAVAHTAKRSPIEVCVRVLRQAGPDERPFRAQNMPDAYAVWPTREKRAAAGTATGWEAGMEWELRMSGPRAELDQAKAALRAWILFGGYGSRTRRGMGSLTVTDAPAEWLPAEARAEALPRVLGVDLSRGSTPRDTPSLRGAQMLAGDPASAALEAWYTALGWLRDFRQKDGTYPNDAREVGRPRPRGAGALPGRSRWPEPDKIRRLAGSWTRAPRYNAQPVWPRASFGLPILGQFPDEAPGDFELAWRRNGAAANRLASPLIVKPLALAGGQFVPIALWLDRAYPQAGTVFLKRTSVGVSGPADAPFDQLEVPGDTASHAPLLGGTGMRDAFFRWLLGKPGVRRVL